MMPLEVIGQVSIVSLVRSRIMAVEVVGAVDLEVEQRGRQPAPPLQRRRPITKSHTVTTYREKALMRMVTAITTSTGTRMRTISTRPRLEVIMITPRVVMVIRMAPVVEVDMVMVGTRMET